MGYERQVFGTQAYVFMSKIYKYFSHDKLDLVFRRNNYCGIKCSYPKDYNDPFELFLSIDPNIDPKLLAFYKDVVDDVPQCPTTCFSKSPTVTPMWAHYGGNQTGFVLEFDRDELKAWNENFILKNVVYQNKPNKDLEITLGHAAGTKKPRHSLFLQRAAFSGAYFTKSEQWNYEQECRLVVNDEDIEIVEDSKILFVPVETLSSIIVGPNFPAEQLLKSQELDEKIGLEWYQLNVGKSVSIPFMKNKEKIPFVASDDGITEPNNICDNCEEPVDVNLECCLWCRITENHEFEAAQTNPFRLLEAYGELENYFAGTDKIAKKHLK